jgi:trimethylamine--corrinoid protein Co-methyltransferase
MSAGKAVGDKNGRVRRRGGRGRDTAAASAVRAPSHYRHLRNCFRPMELLSTDEVESIHETSLTILKEIGIRVLHDEARGVYARAGALVDDSSMMVRLDGDMIMEALASAPPEFDMHVHHGAPYRIGGPHTVFATVGGPPNISDLDGGRRPGTMAAYENLLRLAQSFDVVHMLAPMVEPMDVDLNMRALQMTYAQLTLTAKIPFLYSRGQQAVEDGFEMLRIAHGLSDEGFFDQLACFTVINANSPLQLDIPMCQGILDFARHRQLMVLTPFTLAGAMAPVSLAGALAQQNAEALAGMALAQLVNPGTPVAYGGFTSNVDMKSGAPAFGTPEYVKAALATGQLVRKYNVPWRSSNANASNAPDAQAAYESQMSIWATMLAGCNIMMHGAGWLEGGLTASMEKFIIDVEMLQMMAEVFQPLRVDPAELALDAVREVGPGGHYFGAAHTLERYETAFYAPLVSDWRNFENWQDAGSPTADQRANAVWKETLRNYAPPPMDEARREELDAFLDRRTREGGAPPVS